MRLLYVAEAFGGGVFELVKMTAEGAAAEGHQVAIAHGRRPETPERPSELIDPRVELFELPWMRRSPGAQVRGMAALRRLARTWQPQLIHAYSSFAGVHCVIAAPGGVPVVFTPQAYAFTMSDQGRAARSTYRLAESFASRRAAVVGACSADEARLARQLGARRVETVANGIPELDDRDLPDRASLEATRVIAIGRTVPQRRPAACARVLGALEDGADVAWIGGAGGSRGVAGAEALHAAGVPVSGWLPRHRVLRELERATAYLHWTAWDGLPLSVLEAMARDTVVVASDIGPNRELLGDRQVCAGEAEAVGLLRAVLTDRALGEALLAEQRRRRTRYGAEAMVEGWLRLYGRLARQAS
jgi:glycosyltransferase involved in cell wall biosynthesis